MCKIHYVNPICILDSNYIKHKRTLYETSTHTLKIMLHICILHTEIQMKINEQPLYDGTAHTREKLSTTYFHGTQQKKKPFDCTQNSRNHLRLKRYCENWRFVFVFFILSKMRQLIRIYILSKTKSIDV